MRLIPGLAALLIVSSIACARGRSYELRGQVISVDTARREITVKHQDIRGFMPGMTMTFKVRNGSLMEGRTPGELIRATLVVGDADAYLSSIERTGTAPVPDGARPAVRVALLNRGELVPDATFVDQNRTRRQLSDWRGRAVVVTFIYTRCPLPNFCPLMDRHFAETQRDASSDPGLRGRFHLLSVSFDPAFDTPAILADHARRVGADPATWSFATGERDEIDRFGSYFGVSLLRDDPVNREIAHNLRTALIDSTGRLVKVYSGNEWTAAELVSDLRNAVGVR